MEQQHFSHQICAAVEYLVDESHRIARLDNEDGENLPGYQAIATVLSVAITLGTYEGYRVEMIRVWNNTGDFRFPDNNGVLVAYGQRDLDIN